MEQQDRYIRFDWAVKVPSPPKSKFWCVRGLLDCAFGRRRENHRTVGK